MDLETTIKPVVEQDGLELVEVFFGREGGQRVLRVTVDREGGLDLDAIAETSERISRRLDLVGFEPGPYRLEVSSPGLERPLRTPADFARRAGEMVKVRIAPRGAGPASAETLVGTIVRVESEELTIGTEAGERTVAFADIANARTVFEWGNEKRAPGRREKV